MISDLKGLVKMNLLNVFDFVQDFNIKNMTVKDLNSLADRNIFTICRNGKIIAFTCENMTLLLH